MVVGTPLNSGDTAAVGELSEETPTECTERAGEKDPGEGEVGVGSFTGNSSSLSAEGVKRGQTIRQSYQIKKYEVTLSSLKMP